MAKILFVGKNSKTNNIYSMNLNMYLGVDVVLKHNKADALNFIKNAADAIKLIIVAPKTNEVKTALTIYKELQMEKLDINIISMQENKIASKVMTVYKESVDISVVIKKAAQLLGMNVKKISKQNMGDYCPIPLKYFYFIDTMVCDTYLRIKKSVGDDHFIKKYRQGDVHSQEEIKRYYEKGVNAFYVPTENGDYFISTITRRIINKMENSNTEVLNQMEDVDNGRDVISGIISTRGITEETAELAKASIKRIISISAQNPTLKKLLEILLNSKTSYRYRVCQLTTFVVFHMISNMEWGSKEQQDKLAFVSFFHDILLQQDKLAVIDSENGLSKTFLSKEEDKQVKYHAKLTSELLQKYPRIPIGAENIILHHHGKSGGVGFSKVFSNNLESLTIAFIVAEKYSRYQLLHSSKLNHEKIVTRLNRDFPKSMYKKVIRTLVNFEV